MAGVPDPRGLEGRSQQDESGKLRPREFFWDSIVLYVVGVIIGLTAIDVVTEYIRGSAVECFSPNGTDPNITDYSYINNLCSDSLPVTSYFTAFIFIHGILIAIPHYLWLNHFGGSLSYFFHLVSSLERLKDAKSGEYPDQPNVIIVRQLEAVFTTYKRNDMFLLYVGKLILQWLLSVAGLIVAFVYFTDFDTTFRCPRSFGETTDEDWPIPNQQVICVFNSLRLIGVIRIGDIILLFIVILCLTWSLLWVVSSHVNELGYKDTAIFSFRSGLEPKYYVPNFPIPWCCLRLQGVLRKFFTWLYGPRISDDMGFLMMMLFRTDGGLGHVVKEVQIQKAIQNFNDDELRRLNLHRREQMSRTGGELVEKSLIEKSDLKWQFEKGPDRYKDGVYDCKQWEIIRVKDPVHPVLVLPDSFRGAVLGFASYAHSNVGALYVSFGSPSVGVATALGRVFGRVGSINFSPVYRNPDEKVKLDFSSLGMVSVLCPDDILTGKDSKKLLKTSLEIWMPGISEGAFEESDPVKKTDFIVIGPLDNDLQKTTVNLLLELIEDHLSENVILMSVYLLKISGKDVHKDFQQYLPPKKYFCGFTHSVTVNREVLPWPTAPQPDNDQSEGAEGVDDTFAAATSSSKSLLDLPAAPATPRPEQPQHQVAVGAPNQPEPGTYSNLPVVVGNESQSLFRFMLSQWKKPKGNNDASGDTHGQEGTSPPVPSKPAETKL